MLRTTYLLQAIDHQGKILHSKVYTKFQDMVNDAHNNGIAERWLSDHRINHIQPLAFHPNTGTTKLKTIRRRSV